MKGEISMREEGARERERRGLDFEGFWERRVKDEGVVSYIGRALKECPYCCVEISRNAMQGLE